MSGNEVGDVGHQCKAGPVDNGFGNHSRAKTIRIANDPRCQHTAAGTPGDVKPVLVDKASRNDRIDTLHQVIVILARVIVMDLIGKGLTVTRRATRIRIKHDIASCRIQLHLG